ncbi:MAG: hypothetical protein NT062_22330 [Proteobacteria bacterium]|nr:hypothetical protein [Pseudomonadota bacterium]
MTPREIELAKLARVFGTSELPFVDGHDAAGLRALRERISATLFDDARPMLLRVAKASRLLPNASVAKVGEKLFGGLLCAHIASLLATDHALDLAIRMPDAFLAEVAAQLDPRGAHQVVAAIPGPRVVAVAVILVERGDFMTLGRFVDYIATDTTTAVIAAIADELALLEVAKFVESAAKLAELIDLVPDERLRRMVLATDRDDAWPALLPFAAVMTDRARAQTARIVEAQPPATLARIVTAALADPSCWTGLRAIAAVLHPDVQYRLAALVVAHATGAPA